MARKKVFVLLVMMLAICGLLLTVSCAKPKVKSDAAEVESAKALPAGETSSVSAEELAAQDAAAAAGGITRDMFVNENVLFDFDRSTLTPAAREILKGKAAWLRANPNAAVTIEGHCDERGTTEYNLALGDRRAKAAKDFLVDMGIAASRLSTISYGEEKPLVQGSDEAAWAQNRRAQFVIR